MSMTGRRVRAHGVNRRCIRADDGEWLQAIAHRSPFNLGILTVYPDDAPGRLNPPPRPRAVCVRRDNHAHNREAVGQRTLDGTERDGDLVAGQALRPSPAALPLAAQRLEHLFRRELGTTLLLCGIVVIKHAPVVEALLADLGALGEYLVAERAARRGRRGRGLGWL